MCSLKPVFFLLFCICIKQAHGQFTDTTRNLVNLSATGNFNRTVDGVSYLFNNSAKYGYRRKDFIFNANAKWVYGTSPQKLTNNDILTSLDFNRYKFIPRFYYWGLLNFTSSYSLRINQQWQAGLGLAYRIIDQKNMMLSISDGILFEHTNLVTDEDPNLIYQTYRNSLRLQYRVNHRDMIKFNFTGFYQPSLQYGNDYIINITSNLEIKIWKWLNMSGGFTYNTISRTNRENMLITYGLVAERYF